MSTGKVSSANTEFAHGRKPLAERLVQEATAIVVVDGPDSLSLREVQRRAGVSPAAAYRHFRDRDALLLAVAQEAAGVLAGHVAAAMAAVPASASDAPAARSRLLAACEGYLDFATGNPGLYRAVFYSNEQIDELTAPTERARGSAGEGGYNLLVAALQDVVTATGGTSLDPWDPLVVWSACHGLAMLRLDAALRSLPDEEFARARDRVLRTIVAAVPLEALAPPAPLPTPPSTRMSEPASAQREEIRDLHRHRRRCRTHRDPPAHRRMASGAIVISNS